VTVPERGAVSYGSGALVGVDPTLGLVLTNWHVICDAAGPIEVSFPDGFRSTAAVLATDRQWDLAALAIRRPRAEPISLASDVPRRGDPLMIAGYGDGWYRASTGRCTQYVSPGFGLPFEMVELDTAARQGDSGGPILNHRGELAGVLFGAGFGRTAGSHCGRVRRFLDTVADDFEQLSAEMTMIARRTLPAYAPLGDAAGSSSSAVESAVQAAHRPKVGATTNAPIAAITGGPYRLPSGDTDRQPSARHDLAELPVPRPYAPPAGASRVDATTNLRSVPGSPGSAEGTAAPRGHPANGGAPYSEQAGPPPGPQPAGPTRAEQIKTILAGIGILAILLHAMRLLGAAAQS
jgi:hypothetical protein